VFALAEVPDWEKWIEEERKKFEELGRTSGAIIASCLIAGSFMLVVGAYVWWFKVKFD